jgi:hypothetical protein
MSTVVIGLIGMLVLSRHRYLKNNHFWLLHRYYLRVAEAGIYGLISLLVFIFTFRRNQTTKMNAYIVAAICVTCIVKLLFSGLAGWSYFQTRQARKAHEKLQPQAENGPNDGLSPYVQMLVGFGGLPAWHMLLSTLFIWMIIAGFISIPPSLITYVEIENNQTQTPASPTSLMKEFAQNEPLYVQFHFTAFFVIQFRCWYWPITRFAIGITLFFAGLIGMLVLSRHRYLKNNHFWLFHRYYLRVAEAGIYGLISLVDSVYLIGDSSMDAPTVAVICVTCVVTALFMGFTSWEYFKMRQATRARETSQP